MKIENLHVRRMMLGARILCQASSVIVPFIPAIVLAFMTHSALWFLVNVPILMYTLGAVKYED